MNRCVVCGTLENIHQHHISQVPAVLIPLCSKHHKFFHWIRNNIPSKYERIIEEGCIYEPIPKWLVQQCVKRQTYGIYTQMEYDLRFYYYRLTASATYYLNYKYKEYVVQNYFNSRPKLRIAFNTFGNTHGFWYVCSSDRLMWDNIVDSVFLKNDGLEEIVPLKNELDAYERWIGTNDRIVEWKKGYMRWIEYNIGGEDKDAN